mmetsp:Transcript_1815/g.6105  ORF Transcript_1815/g.6105 Transcript_1815/m.6105 type:complete len:299 (+) Transcript_1815:44-940(+)
MLFSVAVWVFVASLRRSCGVVSTRRLLVRSGLALASAPLSAVAAQKYVEQVVVDASGKQIGTARRLAGVADLSFQEREVTSEAFRREEWPLEPPFVKDDFRRLDESDDGNFYEQPRLVYHVDEGAVAALTKYYETHSVGGKVLDVCSSWVSHFPEGVRGVGVGMNDFELRNNRQLDSYVVRNLNLTPELPFPDDTFDFATIVVSVDYLTKPLEVLREIRRVLKKTNGRLLVSQSNRCFYTKAIAMWLKGDDYDHLDLIGQYLKYAGFPDDHVKAFDVTPSKKFFGTGDPLFMVDARAG